MNTLKFDDLAVELDGAIGRVEIRRPPYNYFDAGLISDLAEACEALDAAPECRVIVLAAQGKAFCAGGRLLPEADAQDSPLAGQGADNPLYLAAVRLFRVVKPIIAEVQGPAIGGGLGLALAADFRIAGPQARFAANFVKLGIHPGFGISHTLPRLLGEQKAALMLLTGRRIRPQQALDWGLIDQLVASEDLRQASTALATEIAEGAPLAVQATRASLRCALADAVLEATRHEFAEQRRLARSADFAEGLRAVDERRPGHFLGR